MKITTPNVDTIIQGDCREEMKKLPDISRNSRREQAKIFCVEEILPDALAEIERLRAALAESEKIVEHKSKSATHWYDEHLRAQTDLTQSKRVIEQQVAKIKELETAYLKAQNSNLLRKQEIERLRASLIDLHAEYINTLEKNPDCSAWDLDEQSDADQRRLRRNAAHAISITEPLIYIQAEQQATKIRELKADLEQAERVIEARLEVIDQQAAKIRELEDALVEYLAADIAYAAGVLWSRLGPRKEEYRERARQQLQAEGKIGPDAKPRSWQITDERKAAIDRGLQFLEWSYAKNSAHDTKEQIAVLWAMLDEDTHDKP